MSVGINEESRAIERMMKGCVFGAPVYHFDRVASTQTEAKRFAASGTAEGTLIMAREQTGGYGRKGDAWHSALGGLWFSMVLRPKFSPDLAEQFSIRSGFAVSQALNEHLPQVLFEVKAPNDVLAVWPGGGKRKVCGLILEGSLQPDGAGYQHLILGVGINVDNELPAELSEIAGTLEQLAGKPVVRMRVLKSVLEQLSAAYSVFSS